MGVGWFGGGVVDVFVGLVGCVCGYDLCVVGCFCVVGFVVCVVVV